jgi:hypothetical protein
MKNIFTILAIVFALSFSSSLTAQDKVFTDGSVWEVSLIQTSANMNEEYLKGLKNNWVATHEEAVKQGLIVSYKVLSGSSANPDDWDIMLLTEYKSLAAMEASTDKWEQIEKKVIGGEETMKKLNDSRVSIRTIYGVKQLREVIYNK